MWLDQDEAQLEKYPGLIVSMSFKVVNMLNTMSSVQGTYKPDVKNRLVYNSLFNKV